MSVTVPSGSSVKPDGAFIHAFTASTQNVPNTPDAIIGIRVSKCVRWGNRPQP